MHFKLSPLPLIYHDLTLFVRVHVYIGEYSKVTVCTGIAEYSKTHHTVYALVKKGNNTYTNKSLGIFSLNSKQFPRKMQTSACVVLTISAFKCFPLLFHFIVSPWLLLLTTANISIFSLSLEWNFVSPVLDKWMNLWWIINNNKIEEKKHQSICPFKSRMTTSKILIKLYLFFKRNTPTHTQFLCNRTDISSTVGFVRFPI